MIYGTSLRANFVNMFMTLSDNRLKFAGYFLDAITFSYVKPLKNKESL